LLEIDPYQRIQLYYLDKLLDALDKDVLSRRYPYLEFIESMNRFTVILSHDWDLPRRGFRRRILAYGVRLGHRLGVLHGDIDPILIHDTSNPLPLVNILLEHGIRSTIFVRENIFSSNKVGFIGELVSKGFSLGLHIEPRYIVDRDVESIIVFKERVERVFNVVVVAGRNHTLYFNPEITWKLYKEAGLCLSSNLGFNNAAGFPLGIPYAFRTPNGIVEVPVILMDCCLWRDMGLGIGDSLKLIDKLLEKLRRARGIASVNIHFDYGNYHYAVKILDYMVRKVLELDGEIIDFNTFAREIA